MKLRKAIEEADEGCMLMFSPKGITIVHPGGRLEVIPWEYIDLDVESDIEDRTYSRQSARAIARHLGTLAGMFEKAPE